LAAGVGLAAFLLAARLDSTGLLKISAVLLLLGLCGVGLEIAWKREEYVARGDTMGWGHLSGLQAVASGVSYVVLALALLVPTLAWVAGVEEPLLAWVKTHSGAAVFVGGLWLFLNSVGVILGQAISNVGLSPEGAADRVMFVVNAALEKVINMILGLVALALMALGMASLLLGKGPLTLLLQVL
jgi:hypothetical protein